MAGRSTVLTASVRMVATIQTFGGEPEDIPWADKIDAPSPKEFGQCFPRRIADRPVVQKRHFVRLGMDLNAPGVVLFCESWKTRRRIDNAGSPDAHEKVIAHSGGFGRYRTPLTASLNSGPSPQAENFRKKTLHFHKSSCNVAPD